MQEIDFKDMQELNQYEKKKSKELTFEEVMM